MVKVGCRKQDDADVSHCEAAAIFSVRRFLRNILDMLPLQLCKMVKDYENCSLRDFVTWSLKKARDVSFLLDFSCRADISAASRRLLKYRALRVSPAVTRLTVYRGFAVMIFQII